MPPPHSTSPGRLGALGGEEELCSRGRPAAPARPSRRRGERLLGARQSATLSSSGMANGSRSTGVRNVPERASTGASAAVGCAGRGGEGAARSAASLAPSGVEAAVAGEAPGAADEHPHADSLALGVASVSTRPSSSDRLAAPHDAPCSASGPRPRGAARRRLHRSRISRRDSSPPRTRPRAGRGSGDSEGWGRCRRLCRRGSSPPAHSLASEVAPAAASTSLHGDPMGPPRPPPRDVHHPFRHQAGATV